MSHPTHLMTSHSDALCAHRSTHQRWSLCQLPTLPADRERGWGRGLGHLADRGSVQRQLCQGSGASRREVRAIRGQAQGRQHQPCAEQRQVWRTRAGRAKPLGWGASSRLGSAWDSFVMCVDFNCPWTSARPSPVARAVGPLDFLNRHRSPRVASSDVRHDLGRKSCVLYSSTSGVDCGVS
jgi:hypothetical protein